MKRALLDTDILSLLLRGNIGVAAKAQVQRQQFGFLCFSIITYYEILNGLLYKDAKSQLTRFKEFALQNEVISLTMEAANQAADIYAKLRKEGQPIGHTDCLIAGIARTNDFQLVTNNVAHFSRIKPLDLVNWLS